MGYLEENPDIFSKFDNFTSFILDLNMNNHFSLDSIPFSNEDSNNDLNIIIDNSNENIIEEDISKTGKSTNDITFNVLKKNQFKGRKKNSDNREYYGPCHNKYSKDNITSKIQVHYLTFILNFVNIVIEELKIKLRFKKINHVFKKIVNKTHILKLKNSTIGEILCQEISPKYTKNTDKNKKIFQKIKNVPIIEDILSSKYLDLFNIYKEGKKNIKLKKININLDDKKIEMFEDFKQKNIDDSKYIEKINEYIEKYINE